MLKMPSPKKLVTTEDLNKFTIPQLRAVCQENKLKVSTKVNKATLIRHIINWYNTAERSNSLVKTPNTALPARDASLSTRESKATDVTQVVVLGLDVDTNPSSSSKSIQVATSRTSLPTSPSAVVHSPQPLAKKRKADTSCSNDRSPKKLETNKSSKTHARRKEIGRVLMSSDEIFGGAVTSLANSEQSAHTGTMNPEMGAEAPARPVATSNSSDVNRAVAPRRFIPVIAKGRSPAISKRRPSAGISISFIYGAGSAASLYYLDFPIAGQLVRLETLSLPPPLSQHKKLGELAVAFALVSFRDLYQLSQVSRMFRYAVYMSAVQRLSREFAGRRLNVTMRLYPGMVNFWPYLRARRQEHNHCRDAYQKSFLAKAFEDRVIISSRLWASPDHGKQATLAVRFLLTRLFFHVSTGHAFNKTVKIMEVQEIVKGEIWSIETLTEGCTEVFYVLEATCEVIGHRPPCSGQVTVPSDAIPLRLDWSTYIKGHMSQSSKNARPPSLMERLNWTNHEEYHQGISKLWLGVTRLEGETGVAKRLVAERYVLACVVGNGISGRWMSSAEMAQEFDGRPAQTHPANQKRGPILSLFLPAHHHVESIHFTTSASRKPLHPALAVVQTPGREYYVLKDNGMQVGCEESGIAPVWMELLGCEAYGRQIEEK